MNIFGFTLLRLLENAFMKLSLPLGMFWPLVPPCRATPHKFSRRSLFPWWKVPHVLGGETLGLSCMQAHNNTLFSWCVMFEENNMNFMNSHGNEIMQCNCAKMQKKLVFWKWIFFCLDFTIATQQNTVDYSEKTLPEKNKYIT